MSVFLLIEANVSSYSCLHAHSDTVKKRLVCVTYHKTKYFQSYLQWYAATVFQRTFAGSGTFMSSQQQGLTMFDRKLLVHANDALMPAAKEEVRSCCSSTTRPGQGGQGGSENTRLHLCLVWSVCRQLIVYSAFRMMSPFEPYLEAFGIASMSLSQPCHILLFSG